MRTESKNAVIVVLIVAIGFSGIGNLIMSMITIVEPVSCCEVFKVAKTNNPVTMDPVDSWDSTSNDMLDQVVETLTAYDITDPDLPLVGRLAESWYWPDNTTIEFKLRENVFFHDGTRFTADCVLHTIQRINFFGNWSGTLDPETYTMAFPHSLYKFRDGIPIFNDTLSFATDDYTVTLVLNRPYAPAEGLLGYTASSILHPDSTPLYEILNLGKDLVIGTGPFKLVSFIRNSEIRFRRWERYWRTGPYWEDMVYVYYEDAISANKAMLAGDIDYLGQGIASYKPDFEADPDITVTGDGTSEYINGPHYWYITFNALYVNQTWRKAISYAFNYSYLIHDIKENTVLRANSLVPPGFPAHNSSVIGAHYNISLARQYMQSMGYGVGWDIGTMDGEQFIPGDDEALWQAAAWTPAVGNFTGGWIFPNIYDSYFKSLLIQRFTGDMDLIGIEIAPPPNLDYDRFIRILELNPDRIHIFYCGNGPDYFETFNMINPLVNPESTSNFGKINNTEINTLLALATTETDTAQRYKYYKKLQYLVIDKYAYHLPLMYDKLYYVHASNLKGIHYNCMRSQYWYPTYRE